MHEWTVAAISALQSVSSPTAFLKSTQGCYKPRQFSNTTSHLNRRISNQITRHRRTWKGGDELDREREKRDDMEIRNLDLKGQ